MTSDVACPVLTTADAIRLASDLAADFAIEASHRDLTTELPFRQMEQLSSSGLLAITVPAEYGGADLPPSVVAEVIRILSAADPSIGQIPHSHFVYVNLLRLAGTPDQVREYSQQLLLGARIANAQAERNTATAAEIATTLTPAGPGRYRIDGTKYYCTGSLFATVLTVLTKLDDPYKATSLADGQYVVFLPADTPGITIVDDWNGMGQKTTGSGTIRFEGVVVDQTQVVPRSPAVGVPSGYGAFAQLMHAAIDAGVARGALDAAAAFAREKSRPWYEAGVPRAIDDPLLVQRFGELDLTVRAAEAALTVAGLRVDATRTGGTVDPDPDQRAAEASLAVAAAKILADKAANEISSALFEVCGTRSTAADLNLDRFWRDARTHTSHDPVRWKYQHLGRSLLHGTPPPLHAAI